MWRFLPRRASSVFALLALAGLFVSSSAVTAQDWTRFRGPNGSGESEAAGIPASWTHDDLNWKVELPGVGHSSPVLWGDSIFLLSADKEKATRYVISLDAKAGKTNWKREFAGEPHHLHVRSSYASCTPAVDEKHVYVAWSDPNRTTLMALDHTGADVWSIDLGPWVSQHGFGTSPMLYEDLVVITCSQENSKRAGDPEPKESFVVAVDKNTGKIRWRTDLKLDTTSYSVPCVRKAADGRDELLMCSTGEGIFGVDALSGKINWNETVFNMRTVSSPVLVGGLVVGTTGSGGGGNYVIALKPGPQPEIAYEVRKEAPYVPTPVARGNLLFLWSDKGIVHCLKSDTGEEVWKKRVGGVGYSGSPIRVQDKLICVDEAGLVVVLSATDTFAELARIDLKEECRSTPAVSNGRLYIRTISHLFSVGGKTAN
ncbi:Pyrrolo-quinoline quinone [Pirellula staleyi DSM 6068]|uniref:Pyrrolo-quinoline quinone n=1 Tax=Pirellula staleyi (strain ATCC 27377 / DSM 6068 / ICPB 4128) TaxID=530564 RepID=D2R1V4_PIRSD|nr:PQQ-binding-like beta-propeller repeat protein [Pirellula staleyi]ADB16823.1 Pyrrolo-quinoline quinone [Pirellula staleyi DSM 6068]